MYIFAKIFQINGCRFPWINPLIQMSLGINFSKSSLIPTLTPLDNTRTHLNNSLAREQYSPTNGY